MNHHRLRRRAGSVSDRSLATSASRSAPSSAASRHSSPVGDDKQHWLPQEGEGNRVVVVSRAVTVGLTSISGCAHADQNAHKFDRLVRVGALTNKGSHKLRESVRSARRDLKSNVDVSRASVTALTAISPPPRRAAGVSRPVRGSSNSGGDVVRKRKATRNSRANETGALRPPLASPPLVLRHSGKSRDFSASFGAAALVPYGDGRRANLGRSA